MVLGIISAICGCGWLATLIMFFVQRSDNKKEQVNIIKQELEDIKKQLKRAEKDNVRTQLLLLMRTYSEEDEQELLRLAEYYFAKLKADWYLTAMFSRFLLKHGIAQPSWFEGDKHENDI